MVVHKVELLFTPKQDEQLGKDLVQNFFNQFPINNDEKFKVSESVQLWVTLKYLVIGTSVKASVLFEKQGRVTHKEIKAIESLAYNMELFGKKERWTCYRLEDDNTRFFQSQLNSLFFKYESALRSLIYLVLSFSLESKWEDSIPKELTSEARKRTKGDKTNILQHLTLGEIETYLFSKNYISYVDEGGNSQELKLSEMNSSEFLNAILIIGSQNIDFNNHSMWEKHFENYTSNNKDYDVEEQMNLLREARNTVAHFKTITFEKYQVWKKSIKGFIDEFHCMSDNVLKQGVSADFGELIYSDLQSVLSQSVEKLSNNLGDLNRSMLAATDFSAMGRTAKMLGDIQPKILSTVNLNAINGIMKNLSDIQSKFPKSMLTSFGNQILTNKVDSEEDNQTFEESEMSNKHFN